MTLYCASLCTECCSVYNVGLHIYNDVVLRQHVYNDAVLRQHVYDNYEMWVCYSTDFVNLFPLICRVDSNFL